MDGNTHFGLQLHRAIEVWGLPISLIRNRDRDSGLSQEHGINLDETGEIVELVGCFF